MLVEDIAALVMQLVNLKIHQKFQCRAQLNWTDFFSRLHRKNKIEECSAVIQWQVQRTSPNNFTSSSSQHVDGKLRGDDFSARAPLLGWICKNQVTNHEF